MAGMPIRRARKAVEAAMTERERKVQAGEMTPDERDAANRADENMLAQMSAGRHKEAMARPDGGDSLLPETPQPGILANTVPVYPKSPTEEWLIDRPEEIAKAYDGRADWRVKMTDDVIERLLFLVRCGVSVKDTREGPGAARQCGLHPATVWDKVHSDPEFAGRFRDARDAAAEVLEDEMRAMLPTAMKHPELVRSLEFVAGRLEWLARVRNRDRYGEQKQQGNAGSITFNIGALAAPAKPEPIDVTPQKSAPVSLPAISAVTVPSRAKQPAQ